MATSYANAIVVEMVWQFGIEPTKRSNLGRRAPHVCRTNKHERQLTMKDNAADDVQGGRKAATAHFI